MTPALCRRVLLTAWGKQARPPNGETLTNDTLIGALREAGCNPLIILLSCGVNLTGRVLTHTAESDALRHWIAAQVAKGQTYDS